MESILIHDWRLMGRTSLLMFPIYGCGAILAPIGSFADRWIGDGPLSRADRIIRHGLLYMVLIFTAEYLSGVNGLIRLDFAPLWFATGLLFEQISKFPKKRCE